MIDRDTLDLLERLRKKLDLVEAYWYFVENGVDGHNCGNAVKALEKFEKTAAPEVRLLIGELNKRLQDGRD